MEYISTAIEGVYLIKPRVFNDARGYFMEAFKQEEFDANVYPVKFVQDNESMSSYGVLRGLHYQRGEWSQAKLVRVIKGRVLDVAVDMRRSSPTFGKYVMAELSDEAVFTYKVDNVSAPQAEASVLFSDHQIGIEWPIDAKDMILSPKDLAAVPFCEAEYFD